MSEESRLCVALASPVRRLQEGPDRARRLGDVGEQLRQRLAHLQRGRLRSQVHQTGLVLVELLFDLEELVGRQMPNSLS